MLCRNRFGAFSLLTVILALVTAAVIGSAHATGLLADTSYRRAESDAMQQKIDRIAAGAATAGASRVTSVSEREVNAYLRFHLRDQVPQGITEPTISILGEGRVSGQAVVDLDAVSRANRSSSMLDPMRYLTGRLPVTADGMLETRDGVGRFVFGSATVSGVPVPRSVLQQVLSYYSRTPQDPDGLGLEDPFQLPAEIREIRVKPREALIVQ